MRKTILVALVALLAGGFAGFVVARSRGANPSPAEAATAKPKSNTDAARLAKARNRIAELEKSLAAAMRAAAGTKAGRKKAEAEPSVTNVPGVVSVAGDGEDVLGALKSRLSHDEFSQVTNAMTQMRARLAEKAKGRIEYLASLDTGGMSDDERKNHARFLELMERREAAAAKMKGGIPDAATIQKLVELEVEMAPVAKKARSALVRQVARDLGYRGDEMEVIHDTISSIFDCTASGGLGGLGDVMEGAEGMSGMTVAPGVSVETHVIGL